MNHTPQSSITNLWQAVKQKPTDPNTWWNLSKEYKKANLIEQEHYAVQQYSRLTNKQNINSSQALIKANQILNHRITKGCISWEESLNKWVDGCEGDWLSSLYLARLIDRNKNSPKQQKLLKQCRQSEPIAGETMHWIGVWRLNSGDHKGATEALAQLVDLRPLRHGSMLYLGEALLRSGNNRAAEVAFTRAGTSANPCFLRMMAQRVYSYNYWKEAIAILHRSLDLQPNNLDTLQILARLHWDVYQLTEAEVISKQILELDPDNNDARFRMNALPGRRGDAIAHLEQVEKHYDELQNPQSRLASSIAMASLYVDNRNAQDIAILHQKVCQPIEDNLIPKLNFNNTKDQSRHLRIGFVTGDFHRQHPINLFMLPLLEQINQNEYPTYVFNTGTMHDEYTSRARSAATHWIDVGDWDDQALQHAIVAEKVDILIDLAGHTSSHRLGVFALRAAPVQATFLGYPHSTGLKQMDWIIGDSIVTPIEHAHLFSERLAQLPGSVFCWAPIDDYPLPDSRPEQAPLVFGSFNNVMKLSQRTIKIWSSLLNDCPDASLLLKAPSLRDPSVIERFQHLFEREGVSRDRLYLEGPSELGQMMQRYGDIDIALDPTPYNGGTTTLQALWMGVPVISLEGHNFVSRMGSSFLQALGHKEWVAHDPTEYLAIATTMAEDIKNLRKSRSSIRNKMQRSSLSNLKEYNHNFEHVLRRIWKSYCNNDADEHLIASY
jgi:protein O-GlcNAc transferase